MGIFLKDTNLEMVLLELLGFLGLALLGWLLLQLIQWECVLENNRTTWLRQLQVVRRQLRGIRRSVEKAQNMPAVPLPPSLRRKWRVVGWITTALSAARWARS